MPVSKKESEAQDPGYEVAISGPYNVHVIFLAVT